MRPTNPSFVTSPAKYNATLKVKKFVCSSGLREAHIMICVENPTLTARQQLKAIYDEYRLFLREEADGLVPVFRRWFLSDSANQAHLLPDDGHCATSIVEQAPLNLTKAAMWVWLMEAAEVTALGNNRFEVKAFCQRHIFEGTQTRSATDSFHATLSMMESTDNLLKSLGGSLLQSCVRTWLFVDNVDINYQGVVKGRNLAFEALGLTTDTRFIASTGIGGRRADPSAVVGMDTYSVIGLREGQMKQLNAPTHLNPTYEYGVTFERATSVDYPDRRHLFISGTASIDNKGQIVWAGDVKLQTARMWENVEVLLSAGGCCWKDVGQIIVYLRDPADYTVVSGMFAEKFPDIPYVIVHAPVCRPGWLVEMECMAMRARAIKSLPDIDYRKGEKC